MVLSDEHDDKPPARLTYLKKIMDHIKRFFRTGRIRCGSLYENMAARFGLVTWFSWTEGEADCYCSIAFLLINSVDAPQESGESAGFLRLGLRFPRSFSFPIHGSGVGAKGGYHAAYND